MCDADVTQSFVFSGQAVRTSGVIVVHFHPIALIEIDAALFVASLISPAMVARVCFVVRHPEMM
jgi:hypothetical protein